MAVSIQRSCEELHARKEHGRWVLRGAQPITVLAINGVRQVKAQCPVCGELSGAISYRDLPRRPDEYPVVQDNLGRYGQRPCVVEGCSDAERSELHHFAPRSVFDNGGWGPRGPEKPEADRWPMAWLCRSHHVEWHRRMVGYRWGVQDR